MGSRKVKSVIQFRQKTSVASLHRMFEIRNGVRDLTHRSRLPPYCTTMHDVVPVSMPRRCVLEPPLFIKYKFLEIKTVANYKEKSLRVINVEGQVLRNRITRRIELL
ncbi:hypothetical protein AAC387_Pa09g0682 [Persea americana]